VSHSDDLKNMVEASGNNINELIEQADRQQNVHLACDKEWSTPRYHHTSTLVQAFAQGVLSADPWYVGYQTPPNFEHRINQFSLAIQQKYEGEEVPKLSLLDMRDFCDIFLHMNCMEWNEVEGPEFCSRYSATLKKRSFIDLDAAKHNVCLFLRTITPIPKKPKG
jgi:hypothetical protein